MNDKCRCRNNSIYTNDKEKKEERNKSARLTIGLYARERRPYLLSSIATARSDNTGKQQ